MKDMIKESVQQVIFKYNQTPKDDDKAQALTGSDKAKSESQQVSERYQADQIAMKVAIEFCLNINEIQYLFTDIYQILIIL